MANLSKPDSSFRLACPFALQNPDHYNEAHTSNCTTHRGFANRQLLRQHIISEHLALCPRCFELKKADSKAGDDKKKPVPDKKIENVLAWRRAHLRDCRAKGGSPPQGRFHLDDAQAEAFGALKHKDLVSNAAVRDAKELDFEWWRRVFRALYPGVSHIPQPDTRFFLPRSEIQKEVFQEVLKIAEALVHGTQSGQVGLPPGKLPDPHKYLQLDPRLIELLSRSPKPKLDMLQLPKVSVPHRQPNSDSGYSSNHGNSTSPTGAGSPPWEDRMMVDDDRPRPRSGDLSYMVTGMEAQLDGLEDNLPEELTFDYRYNRH